MNENKQIIKNIYNSAPKIQNLFFFDHLWYKNSKKISTLLRVVN